MENTKKEKKNEGDKLKKKVSQSENLEKRKGKKERVRPTNSIKRRLYINLTISVVIIFLFFCNPLEGSIRRKLYVSNACLNLLYVMNVFKTSFLRHECL